MGVVENISQYIPFISQCSDGTGREPPDIKEPEPSEEPEYDGLDPS